jgi:hypothetical protein
LLALSRRETVRLFDVLDWRAGRVRDVQRNRASMAVGSMNAATEIPDVFRRMPIELLKRYSQHGVAGARDEIRRRRAEQAKTAPDPMLDLPEFFRKNCKGEHDYA